MTDKELLEFSAKAAGIELLANGMYWQMFNDPAELVDWNPLEIAQSCAMKLDNVIELINMLT